MIERERFDKVIKGLEEVQHYIKVENLPAHTLKAKLVIDDAIALLKAQEPKLARIEGGDMIQVGYCQNCGKLLQPWGANYCHNCGRAVKWE